MKSFYIKNYFFILKNICSIFFKKVYCVNLLLNYELFLAKIITFIIISISILILFYTIIKRKKNIQSKIKITLLQDNYKNVKNKILLSTMKNVEKKIWFKKQKEKNKKELLLKNNKKKLFVLDFKGDVYANEVVGLREEISAILLVANKHDEVLLRLESSGGVIHGYGLAASQLNRLRQKGIRLIVSVDKIAASGGYMMACVADYIVSAPFAIIGSIGVVGQIPNFNKLLKKCNIDFELHTAGDYKRTLTMFGNNTESTRKKFCDELNTTHKLFKSFIKEMRPSLDIEDVSNGEHWFGTIALEKKLVDQIGTSDDILISKMEEYTLLRIQYIYRKKILERFTASVTHNLSETLLKIFFYKNYL
ncbi:putative periplasmic protease [Buchnera aphidicola str. JF99 (Acyrthosiphon pisum)]|nr:probable proteinase sohB [imported] - Buchnera sp. (strain APS) [Buchnera sp. (in: enterobacteria)]ADP66102.1 putative periplasmic protease [Buchnera aphidicola str. LL01 (Acyrthosiphon pisum)]ADP67257.1 putative periplasmic protease [Buchnera aphidicola str. JF99 (Acyrthosiphon pisum)]ADP67785.1 putative periplasmic protease [Buchnera aphidicola str. JF98 (Acyrthosiphon pisum)]BAB12993.1 possible protease sohB [Buchnera aphidicola str. APS (Acyrthosiphon pisum)]